MTARYNGEERIFPLYARPLWDWALGLLSSPLLAPHFVWDAQRLFKHNGHEYERFYTEPWTGDRWWDIQVWYIYLVILSIHNNVLVSSHDYQMLRMLLPSRSSYMRIEHAFPPTGLSKGILWSPVVQIYQ